MTNFTQTDTIVFIAYFIVLILIGLFVGYKTKNENSDDYFLAGRNLPWYTVGASYIGSNISTEHFIGMIGASYVYGICIANWSWMNVFAFSVLIWFFIPYLLISKITTIPEYLERRFNRTTCLLFSWITVIVNIIAFLAATLYSGAIGLDAIFDFSSYFVKELQYSEDEARAAALYLGVFLIAASAGSYSIFGGLNSVAWTDVFQVSIMLSGGLAVTLLGLSQLGDGSIVKGWENLVQLNLGFDANGVISAAHKSALEQQSHDLFDPNMSNHRLSVTQPGSHTLLPWHSLFFSWLSISVWYNCINQTMIQRVFAAKNLWHARMGVLFSGFVQIFLPFIIVIPGLIMFAFDPALAQPDTAYPLLLKMVIPIGFTGLLMAALFGAIQSTVDSVLHSTTTIISLDILKHKQADKAHQKKYVRQSRMISFAILLVTALIAPCIELFGKGVFGYIQNIYAHFAPAFSAVFIMGFLWRGISAKAANLTVPFGIALSLATELFLVDLIPHLSVFMTRATFVWVISIAFMLIVSKHDKTWNPEKVDENTFLSIGRFRHLISENKLAWFQRVSSWYILYVIVTIILYVIFSSLMF